MNGAEKAQRRILHGHRSRRRALLGSEVLVSESGAAKDQEIAEAARKAGAHTVPHVVDHPGVISVVDPEENPLSPPPRSEEYHG